MIQNLICKIYIFTYLYSIHQMKLWFRILDKNILTVQAAVCLLVQLVIGGNSDTFEADDYQLSQEFDKLTQHLVVQAVWVSSCQFMLIFYSM